MHHTIRVRLPSSHLSRAVVNVNGRSDLRFHPNYFYDVTCSIMNPNFRNPRSGSSSGYYYEGDAVGGSSSRPSSSQYYHRPPWSGSHAENSFGGGMGNRVPGTALPYYQYQWVSASQANVHPASSRYSYTTRVNSGQFGGDDMDVDPFPHFEEGVSSSTTAAPRNWEHTGVGTILNSNTSTAFNDAFRFTLLSYNILAAGLLEKNAQIYSQCEPVNLEWVTRLTGIFNEIEKYRPDILCLQEVEAAQYVLAFESRLTDLGYRGVFKKKTGDKDDGCAIFYRASKFFLLEKLEVEFMQPHIPLLNRDNVALLLKLETRDISKRQKLVVGTTHLLFNPRRHDVRLAQTQVLMAELDRFAFSGFTKDRKAVYHPVLMTGDFNCQPLSSVTKLFCDGQLQYLDENGDLIKWLKRSVSHALLPSQCGITDHCQHYKLILERYKRWTVVRSNNFELELKLQEPLVDLFPYLNFRDPDSDGNNSPYQKDIVSLYSPDGEPVEPTLSNTDTITGDSDFLAKAARKLAESALNVAGPKGGSLETMNYPEHLNKAVMQELRKLGLTCNFGSGTLSHNFYFRDVYGARLDRKVNESGVTTKQSGWTCVDYIFQGMTWNDSFNKVVEGKLKLVRRLGLPSRNQCKQLGDIPNKDHPSDHFPLVAEFLIR